jgi:hypothetical protein
MRSFHSRLFLFIIVFAGCNFSNGPKCTDGNCMDGEGTKTWPDGGYRKGTWKNGELNGHGYEYFGRTSDFAGDVYDGNFLNDKYDGQGSYYDKSEDSRYTGHFQEGAITGKGICTWGDRSKFPGRYYEGDWKNGKMDGHGTKFWGRAGKWTNNKYTGEWKDDDMDGNGRYEWGDGSYYEGPWKKGEQDGDGIYVFKNGELFKGHWDTGYCEPLAKKMGLE